MREYYYILKSKLNFKLQETVLDGFPIKLNDYTYIRLSKKPRGRSIQQKLSGIESGDKFFIYK